MNKDQLPYSIVSAFNACQNVEKELNLAIWFVFVGYKEISSESFMFFNLAQ